MGKLRKFAFYLMIPIVIICMISSTVYYREMGLDSFERFWCSMDNTIKMFLARPTIQPYLAFRSINEHYSSFEKIVTHMYGILVVAAPILMTTAIVAGFSAYIFDFVNSIKISFKDKMFIFGDGRTAKVIATKYSKKYYVNYLMDVSTTNEERVPLLKEKVKAYPVDYTHVRDACKAAKLEKASYIVLNFQDWFKSYKVVTDIVEYVIEKCEDDVTIPIYVIDVPGVFRNVFGNTCRGFCQKYGKEYSVLKIKYINVDNANAKLYFKDPNLTLQPDNVHHIIFVGLGGYGRAMLKALASYMVKNGLTGTIDIFDRNIDAGINNLMYSERSLRNAEKFTNVAAAPNARFSVDQQTDAGIIRTNYYQAKMGEVKITQCIADIIEQYSITEFFCCISDVSASFECYRLIEGYGDTFKDTKLYFRVGHKLENAFTAMRVYSSRLEFLPDGFPDIELIEEDKPEE